MKKVLSLFLTLTMLCASLVLTAPQEALAHQNFYDAITFDEVNENNTTGYLYGTGNFTKEADASSKSLEAYSDFGKLTNFHHSINAYIDVAEAPDTRYGTSLGVYHTYGTTDSNPYVQVSYTPGGNTAKLLYGTVHLTASLYVTEADKYVQRALLLKTSENSGYRKYPVLFDYGTNRNIYTFGVSTGKKFSPGKWYDFDVIYNMDSMEFHVKIWEDGELYIDMAGIDGGQKYSYCDNVTLYHSTMSSGYSDQYCYWDNFTFETTDRYNIPQTAAGNTKEIFDFEDFVAQDNTAANDGIPASTRGTWGLGYQGSTELELLKSVTDAKTDDMEVAPNLGKSVAFGCFDAYNEETALDGKNDYLYPQFRYNFNSSAWSDKFKIEFSVKLVNNGVLNLYCKGSNKCNIFRADGTNLYIFNTKHSDFAFNTTDWFDVNILIDGSTGYYNMDIKNRTSPSKPSMYCEGYNSEIISLWDNTDKIIYFQQGTSALARYVYLDNIYWGEADEADLPELDFEDVTATATADAEALATCTLPFASSYNGLYIAARLTYTGATPTVMLGDGAIDLTGLEAGTYPVVIKMLNGDSPSVSVKLNSEEITFSSSVTPTSITLTAPAGEGNSATLSDVKYTPITSFDMLSETVFNDFDVESDVEIDFSNVIAGFSADNVKVYAPNGTIDDTALVDSVATLSEDGKTVTVSFDKEKETHYHITYEFTDSFGATLSDFVEVNTEYELYHNDGLSFYNDEGNEITYLSRGDVVVKTNIFSGDGESYNASLWMALYDEAGNLEDIDFVPVTFEKDSKEISAMVNVPDDTKAYKIKAGIVKPNLAPILCDTMTTQVIIFKLDDIKTGTYENYAALTEWAAAEKVPLAYGMVCNSIDEENDAYIESVKDMVETGYVEIWCHGYDHHYHEGTGVSGEFTDQTAEYQAQILQKCIDNVAEKTDGVVKIQSFGAPANTIDDNTVVALEMIPQYKTLLASGSTYRESDSFMHLNKVLHIESATGVLHPLETLKGFHSNRATGEYMVYQAHGGYWNDENVQIFKDFVSWLKTKDVAIMTPTQYYNFVN